MTRPPKAKSGRVKAGAAVQEVQERVGPAVRVLGVALLALVLPFELQPTPTAPYYALIPGSPAIVRWGLGTEKEEGLAPSSPTTSPDPGGRADASAQYGTDEGDDQSGAGGLTPQRVAAAVRASPAGSLADANWEHLPEDPMVYHWHPTHGHAAADRATTLQMAQMALADGVEAGAAKLHEAANLYRDVLETYPDDTHTLRELEAVLSHLYPDGPRPVYKGNHSKRFAKAMEKLVASGRAKMLGDSAKASVYEVSKVLPTPEAVQAHRAQAERFKARWRATPPLVCFQHNDYTELPELKPGWRRLPKGGQGCLNSGYSRLVAEEVLNLSSPSPALSEASTIYPGQDPLFDALGKRVEQITGLRDASGTAWELLEYPDGVAYKDHLDCNNRDNLHTTHDVRMATVLIPLNVAEYTGGETSFPKLNIHAKPASGDMLVFYNFGPGWWGSRCNPHVLHRSSTVTAGRKLVLHRWYTYPVHPYGGARPYRVYEDIMTPVPWQPTISCDYTEPDRAKSNVSCRWYATRFNPAYGAGS
eukprot:m.131654 g.131654  ORF g.131654 m.131654 type:complete len:532 (-) comp13766_c0_seq1:1176-2771(-)